MLERNYKLLVGTGVILFIGLLMLWTIFEPDPGIVLSGTIMDMVGDPEGQWVIVMQDAVVVMAADGTVLDQYPLSVPFYMAKISPDTRSIALKTNNELIVLDRTTLHAVYRTPIPPDDTRAIIWRSDSRLVARVAKTINGTLIQIIDIPANKDIRITEPHRSIWSIALHPTKPLIAYPVTADPEEGPSFNEGLVLFDFAAQQIRWKGTLIDDYEIDGGKVAWFPDGKYLLIGNSILKFSDTNDVRLSRIIGNRYANIPLTLSPSGTFAFSNERITGEYQEIDPMLYVWQLPPPNDAGSAPTLSVIEGPQEKRMQAAINAGETQLAAWSKATVWFYQLEQ